MVLSWLLKYSLRGAEGGSQTLLGKESLQENLGQWRLQVAQGFLEASRLVYFNSLLGGVAGVVEADGCPCLVHDGHDAKALGVREAW
jgi:hypothetical protein